MNQVFTHRGDGLTKDPQKQRIRRQPALSYDPIIVAETQRERVGHSVFFVTEALM